MTGRFTGLIVTLEREIREDDAGALILAIKQMRGVLNVEGHVPDLTDAYLTEQRVRRSLYDAIVSVIYPRTGGGEE